MNIPKQYATYFEPINAKCNIELQDDKTKIIVRDQFESFKIKVDHGILSDESHGIRKSDFAIIENPDGNLYLIELKGAVIDEAIKQLGETIQNIEQSAELQFLLNNKDKLISCVVSPNRQQIPRGGSSRERALAKKLFAKSRVKPRDMFQLIYYIKVVPRHGEASVNHKTRQVVCSNGNPLILNELGRQ